MAKNLNVSLAFTANTNEAIAAIKRLQKELNGLATGSALKDSGISQITPEIQRAMVAAGELQAKLEAATNLKTGKLDLGQFSDSLKKGGVSLQQYANQLNALGPAGRQAFTNLASSIIQAEAPLIRCSQRVKELGTTLANTARWQISSSILHGFMGTVQSAYGYAQNLNKSLNDIRIVTGASVAEMDAFAAKANKAARALSTTTNEYAKASLIYFQQGDTQAQTMEKAAVTAKMANVTGQSADIVSNQLTAIWNNFNKEGDIAYEHYADVLTKLGAATASSTDEIAGGLEKFAGIADTIGLSYEYAASALATITATSRESEEVVGTALKTIFARIQGLKQGDTLEDGTTLNKYSEALQKVGISIFDQTGELKNMDNILEEMAAKWVTLNKDQQLALAQTVAGVRQYNQMVTLMDNWNFMEENLATAGAADGELNKQAEIYAESWEAARDRVSAAAENLYTKILDDDFFIGFLDGLSHVIDGVGSLVDAFGGLGGVLATIGAIATKVFHKEISQGLRNAAYSIKQFTPAGRKEHEKTKEDALEGIRNLKSNMRGREGDAENASFDREIHMQEQLRAAAGRVTEEELKQLQVQMDLVRAMDKRAIAAGKAADAAREEVEEARDLAKAYEKIEARDKAREDFQKEHQEEEHQKRNEAIAQAFDDVIDYGANHRKTKNHRFAEQGDYINQQYAQATRRVENSGKAVTADAVRGEFLAGLREAAKNGDEMAKAIFNKVRAAGDEAAQAYGEAMKSELDKAMRDAEKQAGKKIENIGKAVDKGAMTEVRAKDLRETASKLSVKTKDDKGNEIYKIADTGLGKVQDTLKQKLAATAAEAKELQAALAALGKSDSVLDGTITDLENMTQELNTTAASAERLEEILGQLSSEEEGGITSVLEDQAQMLTVDAAGVPYGGETSADAKTRGGEDYLRSKQAAQKQMDSENANLNVGSSEEGLNESFNKSGLTDWADQITNTTDLIMGLGSAISSVQGAIDVFNNPDATAWDKISALISVVIGILPVASTLMTMFGTTAATAGATAGAGMTAALGPIGAIILAVTALIAIFIALGSAVAANSPEGQLKSAQEATEKTAQAAQNAKNAYEDLLSTINKYDSAKDSLSELAKGTDEYTEALLKANEAARELIDTYGLTKIDVGEDGLIQLDEAELSEKKAEYRNQVEDTSSALTGAQKYENAKEDQVTRSNLYNDVMKESTHYATTSEGYTYKDNYLINQDNMSKIMEAANTTEGGWDAYFAEGGKNIAETMGWDFENLDSYQQDFINALTNSSSALEEANAAILANAAANEAATKAQLVQNLSDEEAFQNSKYQDELVEAALNTQSKEQTEAQDKLSTMSENEKYNEYAKLMGYTNNGIGTWLDGKQEFLDKDGNKIELTQDQVTAQLEEMYAQEGMEQNTIDLIDTMNKVMARADENKEVISAAISGDVNKLTIGQRGMTSKEVAAMVTDKEAQAMGFESAAAFGESFASATENFAGEWQNLMNNYVESVQNQMQAMFENGELANLTLEQSKNLANAFETAFASSGQAGMKTLQDMFLQTGEYSDEFANAIGTIDWETATPTTLQDALDAAGVATYFTTEQLNNLINAMNSAAPSLDTVTTKYASLHDIIDGLETGDTISEEQFNKFEEYGIAAEDYFMRMADGTYKLIGDAEEFYNKVNGESLEDFQTIIDKNTADNAAIDNVLQYDIQSLGTYETTEMGGHTYMGNGKYYLNQNVAGAQLDFLSQTGYEDTAQIQEWRDALDSGNLSMEEASALAIELTQATGKWTTALGGAETATEKLKNEQEENNKEIEESESSILSSAKSLTSLNKKTRENQASTKNYNKALKGLASQYESCHDEIKDYDKAVKEYGEDSEEAKTAAENLAEALEDAEWKKLAKGIKDYLDELKKLKDNDEIQKVYDEMAKSINDTFDTSITADFVSENIELFKQWRNASGEEAQQLALQIKNAAIMASTDANTILTNNPIKLDVDGDGALDEVTDIGTKWANMKAILEGNPITINANGQADMTGLISALLAAGYTAEEVAALIAAIGQTQVDVEGYGDSLSSFDLNSEEGIAAFAEALRSWDGGFKVTGGQVPDVDAIDMSNLGDNSGGSKPKKAEPTKKSDIVDRYKEVEDKLDDIREEADLVRDSLDRLYGAEHEAAIQRLLELEQQEIDLLKEKEQEARNYLQEDLKELKKVSAEVDVEFKFDDKNNIKNYEEEMTELYEKLAEVERKAGSEWDENEQKEIDDLNEKIKKLEEAMAAYEETRELLEDINAELDTFKGKPALPLITSDTLDIYWEINDALDDIDEKIKDLERQAEGLSGEEKLKVLEEINRLEQERVAILQQQAELNQKDIEEKRAALDELARLNGLQFEYDENGNIANYQEQIGILQAQLDELYAKKAADGLSPIEEEAMNSIIAKMQELADLAGDYRDAVEESEDILNEIEDTLSGMVADPFVRSDFVDIFKETNDQLDDIDRKISKLQNEADKLTGEARRKKLNEIVTLERKRVEILEHQALIAKTEMEDRKRAMEEIAARQELMFEYDENQNITNYQEQLDILIDKYEKAYNEALGDDGLIDATEQAILDSISDDIDHLEEFIQAYCDAVEQLEDIEDEREEIANGGYVDMSQLDDIADELHDINQSLDDLQELLDDSSRAADRLYGEARIKQMEKNASLLQQEIDLLQQKKTAQDDIIAKEKQQLDKKTGGYIKYDEYGRITNYDSYINAREDQIREYEAALQEGGLSETEATLLQDEIDLLNEQIAAMEDYEQALEEKEDIQNQIEDAYYEWQDLNAEKLQYKLELQLDVNDRELAKIERAIKRLDGNFYSRAEALALMVGGGMNGDSKLGNYNKQLADLEAHYQEVKRQYEAGEISQAKYVEMTKELQAEIESTADAMAALQDQMDSYYKDTLAQARQELNFHISQLTHLTGILNHFKNTLTALGKSKDYEMMGTVLEGQVQALENEVKASKNAMQMWQKEADSIYQKYQQALSSGNQENADMYYNAYKEALSAANEAENKFYQQSAAWANALKALMENTLAGLAQDLENALTGGTSFDTITTQMKRASSLQEEYLTTTNKIYETTKLMRTAQQEIDKTTNSVAKQKLSQFITETKQMQNQNKLSKYELSIQQAKYDLLVAEIALEEARFAKSTVRLRRDSEGNFGYIYTADAEAIATAEQKFEDAQNKLYNIGLDGANKYTEKYQQTLAEMYNTLTSLQTKYLQGGFESEAEYNAAVLEAKEYYYEKLNQYSELYSVAINAESGTLTDTLVNNSGIVTDALTKNSRIAADAWSTDFADMTTKTDQWMVAVTDYLSQVQNAFADWEVESQRIANETVGTDLTTLKNKVSDIVTESDNLTAAIGDENNGVIKAIQDEITAVSGLVTEYANLNGQLTQAIQNAQDLSDALQQDIDQAGQDENPPGQYAPGEEESQKPGTVVPEDTEKLPDPPLPEDPPHEHYYVKSKTSPTCTEKGYTTYTCSCGDTYDGDFIDALGHDYTSKVIEEATYERGNLIRYTCQRCGDTYEEYDNNKKDKPKVEGSGKVENPVEPIKPEPPPTKPAEPAKPDNSDKVEGVAASIWMDGSDVSGWGTGNTRKNRLKEKGVSKAQDYINKHAENGDIYAAWHNKRSQLKQYYYGKFDTGGYTGAWGPEGKWAMLHEKEIVLNKEDTKNFLASLELLDNILSTIDLHAMNSQWASNLISPDVSSIGKETLEQMVNIEASFPNATDKHEIEEAFKDLVNLASQYANRK